jgi:uncharacterized membrane protein
VEFVALYVAVILLILGLAGGGVALAVTFPFGSELEQWRREGLVTADQARTLAERHDIAARRERRRRIARALAIAGAITLGLGVILFFAANWSDIPRFGRLAILLVFLVAFLVAGYVLRIVNVSRPTLGHAFLFVGSMLFGASIFLVAQMYHWDVTSPRPFLVWAAGALAIGIVGRADLCAGLSALAFATWIIYETFQSGAGNGSEDEALVPTLLSLYGTALYGLGTGLKPWLDRLSLGTAVRYVGFTTAFLALFALTFREFGFDGRERVHGGAEAVVIVLAAAGGGGRGRAPPRPPAAATAEGLTIGVVTTLVLVFAFAPEHRDENEFGPSLTAYPLAFTFLLVALTIGAIVVGFLNDEAWLVNAAIVFAALEVIVRFVDDSWPTLERSFVFAGIGGVALLIAAALERRRSGTVARRP